MKYVIVVALVSILALGMGVAADTPVRASSPNSCWGQASAVFSQTGEMGKHSSSFPTPRLGLKNLAELLYANGDIPEPTMAALGVYLASELGLSIEKCL